MPYDSLLHSHSSFSALRPIPAFLRATSLNQLKQIARQQLPGVKHAHVLESLAAALGQNNWAALNAKLSEGDESPVRFFQFSYVELVRRLYQLGYRDLKLGDLDFSEVDEIFRTRSNRLCKLSELEASGTVSGEYRRTLEQLIAERHTILIIGPTSSGKSSLMHALLNEMAVRAPAERFALYEIVREAPQLPSNVDRLVRTELDDYLPDGEVYAPSFGERRVAFDDIRDGTAFSAVTSWRNLRGGIGTMHAASVAQSLEQLAYVVGDGVTKGEPLNRLHRLIREGVDAVVLVERSPEPRVAGIVTRPNLPGNAS